jgi:hypothetical protein
MRRTFAAAAALAVLAAAAPDAGAVQPYVVFEAGIVSRDVVEEDASLAGFSFGGTASSTRMLATVGLDVAGGLTLYAQGGAADLTIDEFNGFDSSLNGAYGAGVRFTLPLAQNPFGLRLFVDGSVLRTTGEDTVAAEFGCSAANGCTDLGARGGYVTRVLDEKIEWTEYTVLMGAGSRWGPYGPYGGIRLSAVDATDRLRAAPDANFSSAFSADSDLREQDNFGAFFGTDFFLDRAGKTALNFEVSLFDQYSFRAAIRRTV